MTKFSFKRVLLLSFLVLHASSDPEASPAPMEKAEQEALYLVIQGFVGKWWNGSALYPDPCGWTQIQGVSCGLFDGFWYVTDLSIGPLFDNSHDCANDAEFSPLLFELKHLRSLSFFDCFSHRKTAMPSSSWEKFAVSLESLEFRLNPSLVGGIPEGLSKLKNLQSLVLVENSLSGALPSGLGSLVHLKKLVLAGNSFSGDIPQSLGSNLVELLILDLARNVLNSSLPASLGGLTSLLKLDVSNNILQGSIPTELGRLRTLTLLDLRSNNLSGPLPRSLQGMASLHDLLLSGNPLGGSLSEIDWSSLPNLTTLDLSCVGLTGTIPDSISRLNSLRFLALDNNNLIGTIPSKMAALPSLSSLYINGNNLTGQLEFPEEFYRRMGRRFASWNNPHLCYSPVSMAAEVAPCGVVQCKQQTVTSNYAYDDNPDQSSIGFLASPITGYLCGIVFQGMLMLFLLAILL